MIKLGILDFDTSHAVEFTKRLNHKEIDKEQWVDGAEVVIGCPGESKISPERIPDFTKAMKAMGVTIVDKPEEMIGKVDAMLIESVDGSVHYERAKPFLEAGLPCFVDKPFACSVADAKKMAELAEKKKVPLFSSSSLRYAPEIVDYLEKKPDGAILGVNAYGPASTHPRNPGFFHYGIHAVEMIYALMGPGCETVSCLTVDKTDVATGQWKQGRLATIRGNRSGPGSFGVVVYAEKGIRHIPVGTKFIYRELLKKVVETFEKKKAPVPIEETIELIGFIEAALKSSQNHGIPQKVG